VRHRRSSFGAGNELDFTIQEIAPGRPLTSVAGLGDRVNGHFERTPEQAPLENMDALPFVVDVYRRDVACVSNLPPGGSAIHSRMCALSEVGVARRL
jgi:hypothetical protein